MNPPGPGPGPVPADTVMILQRVLVTGFLVLILGWVLVLLGTGALSIMWGPLCGAGTECAEVYWPRLGVALLGALAGLLGAGIALILCWRRRSLMAWAGLAMALTAATGAWFVPFFAA